MGSEKTAGVAGGAMTGAKVGSAFGPWGTLIGGVVGGAAGLLASGKQKAPGQAAFTPVSIQEEQQRAIGANLSNFDSAATLASKANTFSQSESQRLLEQAIPGISAVQKRLMSEVNKDLDAQTSMPRDVQDQIAKFAAEKGVTRGTSGNFNAFNLVKDFGFNLIDWQQASRARALNTLSTVYGMAPRVNIMSPMASMVDPNTAIGVAQRNNGQVFDSNQASMNAQAAASNYNQSQLSGVLQAVGSVIGSYAGSQVQSKAGASPQASSTPPLLARTGPGYATPVPRYGGK
jgi:hypothetical protein